MKFFILFNILLISLFANTGFKQKEESYKDRKFELAFWYSSLEKASNTLAQNVVFYGSKLSWIYFKKLYKR